MKWQKNLNTGLQESENIINELYENRIKKELYRHIATDKWREKDQHLFAIMLKILDDKKELSAENVLRYSTAEIVVRLMEILNRFEPIDYTHGIRIDRIAH